MRPQRCSVLAILAALAAAGCAYAAAPPGSDCGPPGGCLYEGPPFRFTVVDAETRQPLADVHALAEWVLSGYHGVDGPLMVQDAVSGPDGEVPFPGLGVVRGPSSGLVIGQDPVITLFKPGYKTLRLINASGPRQQTARRRPFSLGVQDAALQAFRGTPEQWVEELSKAAWGSSGRSDEQGLQFRVPYLNRLKRVWAERDKLSQEYQKPGQTFWHVEREIKFLEERKR